MALLLIQGFQGKLVRRGDEGYQPGIYQYATSSHKGENLLDPEAILYPTGDDDVIKAIAYAKEHHVGIAVRTGGHHYTGASSTNGHNIQLDLSHTYTDFTWEPNTDSSIATLGISTTLSKFMAKLKAAGRFVPTGQCSYVNLGGHVQTGGYGHLIRGFGLLSDAIQGVRIINADGKVQWVRRGVREDRDLFWAILGGSPGNFGVITDVTLKAFKDEDYPKSRGFHASILYTPRNLERLLNVMVEMGESEDTPADLDYSLTIVSGRLAEDRPVPGIVVMAQWANLGGKDQKYDSTLFDKITKAVEETPWRAHGGIKFEGDEAPLSTLCSHWVFPIAREFQLPYYKRAYITESKTLKQDGWAKWATERINELLLDPFDGCYVSAQFSYLGGTHSRFRTYANDEMSFSWRKDSTYACTMDVFYDGEGKPKAKAQAWVNKNDSEGVGPKGIFSKQDRRLLWGSRDLDLPAARDHYYDSREKYERLSAIKHKVDPNGIFTANRFSVGPIPRHITDPDEAGTKPFRLVHDCKLM